ncbi:hypothetical protein CHARACLAT_022837, partial [Characodon lateralis]|nr:hypothetical protein [Characodon lateralis]
PPDGSAFSSICFLSTLTSFPVVAEEKHSHSMMLPSPQFTMTKVCSRRSTAFPPHTVGQNVHFCSHLTRALLPHAGCVPYMACRKLQTGLLVAFISTTWPPPSHCFGLHDFVCSLMFSK